MFAVSVIKRTARGSDTRARAPITRFAHRQLGVKPSRHGFRDIHISARELVNLPVPPTECVHVSHTRVVSYQDQPVSIP